jgi:hypothetical protein
VRGRPGESCFYVSIMGLFFSPEIGADFSRVSFGKPNFDGKII